MNSYTWTRTEEPPVSRQQSQNKVPQQAELDRREWFEWARAGLGGAALASLLIKDGIAQPS